MVSKIHSGSAVLYRRNLFVHQYLLPFCMYPASYRRSTVAVSSTTLSSQSANSIFHSHPYTWRGRISSQVQIETLAPDGLWLYWKVENKIRITLSWSALQVWPWPANIQSASVGETGETRSAVWILCIHIWAIHLFVVLLAVKTMSLLSMPAWRLHAGGLSSWV